MKQDTYEKYLTMAQENPEKAYKGLAKVVDQRLVSLENIRNRAGTKSATNYAWKWAMREGRHLYGESFNGRFNRNIRPDELIDSRGRQVDINVVYQKRINAMLTFISLPTSTVSGLKSMYQKIVDTLNSNYKDDMGFEFTVDNIGDFFESDAYEDFESYGSDTILNAIAAYKENEKEIAQKIKEYSEAHPTLPFEEVDFSDFKLDIGAEARYEEIITKMIQDYDVRSLNDMYKGFGQ